MQERHGHFHAAAGRIAEEFSREAYVKRIVLFGSVARPLGGEKAAGAAGEPTDTVVLHKCRDIDLAVWVARTDRLNALRLRLDESLRRYSLEMKYGIAHHQADIYIFDHPGNTYLGRLCIFSRCPKGKYVCRIPGCGKPPFLRRYEDFIFNRAVFDKDPSRQMYTAT